MCTRTKKHHPHSFMSTTKEFVACFYIQPIAVSDSTFQLAGDYSWNSWDFVMHFSFFFFFLASAWFIVLFGAAKSKHLALHYLISPFSHKLSCFFFIQMPRISHLLPSSGVSWLGESSPCIASIEELLEGARDSDALLMTGCFLKTLPWEESTSFAGTWKVWRLPLCVRCKREGN